jgi:type I restriction enzyme S subunit
MRLLSDICELRKETCLPHESNSQVYVGLEHLDSGRFFLSRHGSPTQVRSAKSRFYPGDVLYGKLRPYLDKAVVAETEGICSTDILVLEPISAPSWFLCGVLHSDAFIEHAKQTTHGVNHPRTSWSGVKVFETLTFAPLEQKKIAAVLLKIQRAIETQEKIIQSLRDLKKSTMQHLFTHGHRGEKTKITEIGEIPESWEVVPINSITAKTEQISLSAEPSRIIRYIDVSGISNDLYRVVNSTEYRLSDAPGRARKLVRQNDVIFATVRPTLRRIAFIDEEYDSQVCSTAFCVLRTYQDKYDSRFLFYAVQRDRFIFSLGNVQTGASYPAVTDRIIKSQLVPRPNINEQKKIASVLDQIDSKHVLYESRKDALHDLFKTTLNKLMTGEIRVGNLDIDVSEVDYAEQT